MERADDIHAIGTDPAAFEAFYREHVGRVVAFAAARCRSADEVADLVAATFVEVIVSADRYDPGRGEPSAWLLGIASNVLANGRRRAARERDAVRRLQGRRLLDADDHQRLEDMIDAARIGPDLRRAIDALPTAQREVVHLVGAGLSPSDAARELRITPANARMRLARARRAVRRSLADDPIITTNAMEDER
jgi:RNA polymerase sigma-70 factor (ECF subfamily)